MFILLHKNSISHNTSSDKLQVSNLDLEPVIIAHGVPHIQPFQAPLAFMRQSGEHKTAQVAVFVSENRPDLGLRIRVQFLRRLSSENRHVIGCLNSRRPDRLLLLDGGSFDVDAGDENIFL